MSGREGGFACVLVCIFLVIFLAGSTAQDVKDKRAIEAAQNKFVDDCAKKQDPDVFDYVARLQACRTAAEIKHHMPAYLSRVK